MNTEELKKMIKKMVLDPACAAETATEVEKIIDTIETAISADKTRIASLEEESKKLRDTNIRLYLSATGEKKEEKQEEEKTIDELEAEFVELATGGEKNGD